MIDTAWAAASRPGVRLPGVFRGWQPRTSTDKHRLMVIWGFLWLRHVKTIIKPSPNSPFSCGIYIYKPFRGVLNICYCTHINYCGIPHLVWDEVIHIMILEKIYLHLSACPHSSLADSPVLVSQLSMVRCYNPALLFYAWNSVK